MHLICVVCILLTVYSSANALRCYTCTTTEEDPDQSCITNPAEVTAGSPITNCDKKYCTSMRVEYLDPKDTVQSIYRSCEDNPTYMNQVIEDGTLRIYFRACQDELCNGGTGKDTGGGIITGDIGEARVILVPGTGSSSTTIISAIAIVFFQVLLFLTHT